MKAVVTTEGAAARLALGEVQEPVPVPTDAVVRVSAVSLNRGEIGMAQGVPLGTQIGWDLVGVIEKQDAAGAGPPEGTRVVGFSAAKRAWAERCAVPVDDLCEIPEQVSDQDAAALPVAALTALYAVERGTRLLGARVLVTGATGGVGLFACQLAKLMGAVVVAQVRREEQVELARSAGASEVVVDSDGGGVAAAGPYRLVVDGIGGPVLRAACSQLKEGSRAVAYGVTAAPTVEVALGPFLMSGDATLEGFNLYDERRREPATRGLARLLRLLGDKQLNPFIRRRGDWTELGTAAAELLDRRFHGKAVLTVG